MDSQNLPPLLVCKKTVLHLTSISHTKLYELMKLEQFPKSIAIPGTRRVVWRYADILRWTEEACK